VLPDGERVLELSVVVRRRSSRVGAVHDDRRWTSWAAPVGRVDARVGASSRAATIPRWALGSVSTDQDRDHCAGAAAGCSSSATCRAPPTRVRRADVPAPARRRGGSRRRGREHPGDAGQRRLPRGAAYDALSPFLAGNRWTLEQLVRRFITGPATGEDAWRARNADEAAPNPRRSRVTPRGRAGNGRMPRRRRCGIIVDLPESGCNSRPPRTGCPGSGCHFAPRSLNVTRARADEAPTASSPSRGAVTNDGVTPMNAG